MPSCDMNDPQQVAMWGALLGAAAGAGIGAAVSDDSGQGALIGGLAGAAIGGAVGYYIGKTRQKQLITQQQLEMEKRNAGMAVDQPTIYIQQLAANPTMTPPGGAVDIEGTYEAYGPVSTPPDGRMTLMKSGQQLTQANLDLQSAGRTEFAKTINLPGDAQSGPYLVLVDINHGPAHNQGQANFSVN
ncbi:MAG: putative outer membrane lipoprotein [candidate division BRC1 bacterium ADurb.BinA364]|nr:MAG: putative outer membrane lipoprotein [candidate division BRC1 bacterium ADurb.BinA364]